jgi:hypothetical protein
MIRMIGTVRGVFTLVGAGVAGLLVWVSTRIGDHTTGGYWAVYGILAGAGLTMALSQLFGGWTKWGVPRVSLGVLLIGFLPVLICAGWVLLAAQPHGNWFRGHVTAWSGDIGIRGLVSDLRAYVAVLSFGIGLVFGFTFDTSGPLQPRGPQPIPEPQQRRAPETDETAVTPPAQPQRPAAPVPEREQQPVR